MPHVAFLLDGQTYSVEEALEIAETQGHFDGFPPAAVKRMTETRVDQYWLSPSQADGCFRQQILKGEVDYSVVLEKRWPSGVGTAIHEWLAAADEDNPDVESEIFLKMTLPIYIDGTDVEVPLQGTCDRINKRTKRITDYKSMFEFDYYDRNIRSRRPKEIPTERQMSQIQLYGLLARANGYEVDALDFWFVTPDKKATRELVTVPLWDIEDAYMLAEELAHPVAEAILTGKLPPPIDKRSPNYWMCRTKWGILCPVYEECQRRWNEEGR